MSPCWDRGEGERKGKTPPEPEVVGRLGLPAPLSLRTTREVEHWKRQALGTCRLVNVSMYLTLAFVFFYLAMLCVKDFYSMFIEVRSSGFLLR